MLEQPVVLLVSIGIAFCSISVHAGTTQTSTVNTANRLIEMARALSLGKDQHWLHLLHIPYSSTDTVSGLRSDIVTPEFFLASDGAENPMAELEASIRGFFRSIDADPNNHPRCRYPARYTWIKNRLHWDDSDMPPIKCSLYDVWSLHGQVTSINLIFYQRIPEQPGFTLRASTDQVQH